MAPSLSPPSPSRSSPSDPSSSAQAGYSGTPLVKKLGVRAGARVALVGSPDGWTIGDLPEGVGLSTGRPTATVDVLVAFFTDLVSLRRAIAPLAGAIVPDGALWVAWPRRAGGHSSDITDNEIRAAVLPLGLVDVKVAALDTDWSGLKVVWRKELRAGLPTHPKRTNGPGGGG